VAERAPLVWVRLCARCAGFEPATAEDYVGYLSGRCQGCGDYSRELHEFAAFIHSAAGCRCRDRHDGPAVGDLAALAAADPYLRQPSAPGPSGQVGSTGDDDAPDAGYGQPPNPDDPDPGARGSAAAPSTSSGLCGALIGGREEWRCGRESGHKGVHWSAPAGEVARG